MSESQQTRKGCRCETTIAPAILEGYACGNPDCWRTEPARASFQAFVDDLIRARGDEPPAPAATGPA